MNPPLVISRAWPPTITVAIALFLAASLAAEAQPARIGFLSPLSPTETPASFRQGLQERGYVAGQNVVIELLGADGKLERLPDLAAELYGIAIYMYFSDHGAPHFHAVYGGQEAMLSIRGLQLLEGRLPHRALALVRTWGKLHREELEQDWNWRAQAALSGGSRRWNKGSTR